MVLQSPANTVFLAQRSYGGMTVKLLLNMLAGSKIPGPGVPCCHACFMPSGFTYLWLVGNGGMGYNYNY